MKSPFFGEGRTIGDDLASDQFSIFASVYVYVCVCEWIKSILQLVDVVYTLRCIKNSGFLNKQIEVDSKY